MCVFRTLDAGGVSLSIPYSIAISFAWLMLYIFTFALLKHTHKYRGIDVSNLTIFYFFSSSISESILIFIST